MKHELLPDHWKRFVSQHSLVGREIEFPWPGDQELTCIIEILDDDGVENESREAYPGIVVLRDGFVPVGCCSFGTGDSFFINVHDGPNGPLYKIDHSLVDDGGYDRESAVIKMLNHYQELLNY